MGVETRRRPLLPAPTESDIGPTSREDIVEQDLATDVSRRTDATSYSIPEDGSPITISTTKKRDHKQKEREGTLTRTTQQSQTSLLIEYFEGGKGPNKPSVRVKLTPSSARKSKDSKDHVQITESSGHRRPSYTRRISLGHKGSGEGRTREVDERSISSFSAADDSDLGGRRAPVKIEVIHRDQGSELSERNTLGENEYIPLNPSEVSSMPPDSMLDTKTPISSPPRKGSRSLARDGIAAAGVAAGLAAAASTLKTPSRRHSRSLSRERIAAQKIVERLSNKSRNVSGGTSKHATKSRSRSVSKEHLAEETYSPRRSSGKHKAIEESVSGAESSQLTTSHVSNRRRSNDEQSFISGTSKSSLNNPKLLHTVEDAIRRLILPELNALKHEQKIQQNRSTFERDRRESFASGSSLSREELTRKGSKHASAPNLAGRSKIVLNRDEQTTSTTRSSKGKSSRRSDRDLESPSERSFDRGMSEETVIRDGDHVRRRRSKDSHKLRDAAGGALIGGLTAAALKHHESKSSIDQRERRKKRSKSRSHSRSESYAESTEDVFHKHDVPPMPMRSEITNSDVTRDSLLSERTSTPTNERRRAEIRQVSRGSPREVLSPESRTPTRSPAAARGLATYHSNSPSGDVTTQHMHDEQYLEERERHKLEEEGALSGVAAGALGAIVTTQLLDRSNNGRTGHGYTHGRGLSPIQSVASFREESEPPNRDSLQRTHSSGSLSSEEDHEHHHEHNNLSIKSLSSVPSTEYARSKRHKGISLEDPKEVLEPHARTLQSPAEEALTGDQSIDAWYEQQHAENERYRDSLGNDSFRDSTVDIRHLTNYTDDSMDQPYLDTVTAAHQVQGVGANPEYIHTPLAVESAVASLHDPSVLDVRSTHSGISRNEERSYLDSPDDDLEYIDAGRRELYQPRRSSPLKGELSNQERDLETDERYDMYGSNSPRRNIARSLEEREEPVKMSASSMPVADDPLPEIGHGLDDKSEISTNPSIIHGPLGGVTHQSHTHWPFQPTPPQSKGDLLLRSGNNSAHESLKAAAANMLNAAASAGAIAAAAQQERKARKESEKGLTRDFQSQSPADPEYYQQDAQYDYSAVDQYAKNQAIPTPLLNKDEGYISAANPRSAGALTPDYRSKGVGLFQDDELDSINDGNGDDPFLGHNHMRHLSGNSHGMPSPLYDSATGRGIDRIQSKDVVALMDHLTVRDAHRNARDTEILVTLVRSAAEMRNSFEDMKKFVADQGEMLIDVGNKQHRQTQKIIGGPRPQPVTTPRTSRRSSADDDTMDDAPAKRRSVFRRALRGLGGRNSNDLARIEDMLVHLLDEVEGLKQAQEVRPNAGGLRASGLTSYEQLRDGGLEGYEPEGQAGTSSTGNQSGYFSENPPSRQTNRPRVSDVVRGSQNRVSTVLEGDEENETPLETHEQAVLENQFENNEGLLTPSREVRGGSVPLGTPPAIHVPTGAQSNEHTPKTSTDKSRKHKSSSSSFFPKISRWSKTTASSVADNVRNSGRKERPYSGVSHSGSDLVYNTNEHYDPAGDDRLRSNASLDQGRPPSPLIPSQVSEKPAYEAHRDSLNLQHPQPRPGPTARYQNHLESQAQTLTSPVSPSSDQFGSNPILARYAPGNGHRLSGQGNLSPISDAGYSELSTAQRANMPPRPPKILDDGPLVPQRPPKVSIDEKSIGAPTYGSAAAAAVAFEQANGSPRSASGQANLRKPTGPRPQTSSGNWSPDRAANVQKTRYRGSPYNIEASVENDTF